MSTPNPLEVAAIPTAIAALQAVKQFATSMGTDPAKWVVNYPGAKLILLGTLAQQLPALTNAEVGAVDTALNTQIDSWIATLQTAAK